MIDLEIEYYYGFELRLTPRGVFVSGRTDTRYGDNLCFNFLGEARDWILDVVGLNRSGGKV